MLWRRFRPTSFLFPRWPQSCEALGAPLSRSRGMQSLFTLCAVIYLLLYAFEGAIRYALYSIGMDNAILLRDALVLAPLILLLIAQARRMRIHPAYWAFAAVIALHGAIAYLNIRTTLPVVYGTK